MKDSRAIISVGATMLVLGVFLPLFSLPLLGSITYYENSRGAALVIVALALASAGLAAAGRARFALVTGLSVLGVLFLGYLRTRAAIDRMREDFGGGLRGQILEAIADRAAAAVEIRWGWAVLILGALLVIWGGAAAWRRPR
jgi:hypothetical protein